MMTVAMTISTVAIPGSFSIGEIVRRGKLDDGCFATVCTHQT
jgi:hypothetical protein